MARGTSQAPTHSATSAGSWPETTRAVDGVSTTTPAVASSDSSALTVSWRGT